MFDRKAHWENIYQTKPAESVSWYEAVPETSLTFIKESGLPLDARIIDVGGGDSLLVDHLLDLGYTDLTVLDISEAALARAKKRLGNASKRIKWITEDITNFKTDAQYDLWQDRAVFHFLTTEREIKSYIRTAHRGLKENGIFVIGTFSEDGPGMCSGIKTRQYSEQKLEDCLRGRFKKIKCISADHHTPFHTVQNFVFCSFRKIG